MPRINCITVDFRDTFCVSLLCCCCGHPVSQNPAARQLVSTGYDDARGISLSTRMSGERGDRAGVAEAVLGDQ